ncbi:PAAR-like domain-containing protein [Roseateles terrae]|uniref:Tox-PAAR-like domain-containing protein n=1 Tax=Roseateles terrae TaxID=431060 RepID=A0ABR6GTI4_9BURK|nr:PAAR-like domain-containing protein [Roseateles terrae]MBB3195370.1 hypothetical protein [Roseateles terrae]
MEVVMAANLGARKDGAFKAVSTAPSLNKTPVGSATPPLPYPVTQNLDSSQGTIASVRFNGDPAYVLNQSTQPSCVGDAPGSAKGVRSGTVSGEVKPTKGSSTVRVGKKPVIRVNDPCTMNGGNCPGIYVAGAAPGSSLSAAGGAPAANPPAAPETPAEEGWWGKASPWVHGALGVASFVPGLSVVTGGADALIYAAEGNAIEAGLSAASMIPGGKVVTTAGKAVKGAAGLMKGAHVAEEATKAARVAEDAAKARRVAKEAEDAARLRKAEEEARHAKKPDVEPEAGAGGKGGGDGKKTKPKKKMKCGEFGKYGDLKKKTGDGKFDRDHIPSKAALKARAKKLNGGVQLTDEQERVIENWGNSIAIPRRAHIDHSPTYGQTSAAAAIDSKNLAGSARRDVEAMLSKIDEYDADGNCKKAYQRASRRILRMSNADFDAALKKILTAHGKK